MASDAVAARILSTALVILVCSSRCDAFELFDEFWPEIDIYVPTSQSTRLFFMGSRKQLRGGGYVDGELGAHLDMYFGAIFRHIAENRPDVARSRLLMVRLGYLVSRTPEENSDPSVENTPTIEVTPRYYLPKRILATDRNRYDFRFVDGIYTPRYRNRLKIERTTEMGHRAITPYISVEGFYDRRYKAFHRFRFIAGAEFEINKRFVLEGYYLHQQDSRAEPRGIDVAGVALQIYFH